MTPHEAVEKERAFVLRVQKQVFPNVTPDQVNFCHEDDNHYIQFGGYTFYAVEGEKETVSLRGKVKVPTIKWNMTEWVVQRNYPHEPDDVDERDVDQFDSVAACFEEIARIEMNQRLGVIYEDMQYEAMEEAEEEYENMVPPEPELCPHGNQFHECNACLVAGDMAYDIMRENRHFGFGRFR